MRKSCLKTMFRRLTAGVKIATLAALAGTVLGGPVQAQGTLRIAMTSSDIPTTTGLPNNGFEGMRFLGYPVFESLALWDLTTTDRLAPLRPGLAERWEQTAGDPRIWTFHLRRGVAFHDGTPFNADAVIWNLERYFNKDAAQFEAPASAIVRARASILSGYRRIDDATVELTTSTAASYFPYMVSLILLSSPASFETAGRDWARVAMLPAAGTGPFRIGSIVPRERVELLRHDGYWDAAGKAKLDKVVLLPIPEANARLAALRTGQVDWIEVPPTDGIPSLKQAGFAITTGSYPHVWPWLLNIAAADSPLKDVRVRQALNYCVDRDSIVALLNGTAEPAIGWLKASDADFGKPANRYRFDPAKGRALLAEAGFTAQKPLSLKVMISTSGSGQMAPLPMNEFVQASMKEACGVQIDFNVTEWQVLLNSMRALPDQPSLAGSLALNIAGPSTDPSVMARYFAAASAPPNGFNFPQWKDDVFEAALAKLAAATDPRIVAQQTAIAHERLVDNPPWLYVVHDLNPRAMSRKVQGFISPQSWFVDLARISMQ
ncbi:ABC transporter substrate-binding protein [soil metagenome]